MVLKWNKYTKNVIISFINIIFSIINLISYKSISIIQHHESTVVYILKIIEKKKEKYKL